MRPATQLQNISVAVHQRCADSWLQESTAVWRARQASSSSYRPSCEPPYDNLHEAPSSLLPPHAQRPELQGQLPLRRGSRAKSALLNWLEGALAAKQLRRDLARPTSTCLVLRVSWSP